MTTLRLEIEGRPVELLHSERLVVGRDVQGQGRVSSRMASRQHLELRSEGDRWLAVDLATLNGTFLDGDAMPVQAPVDLRPGMTLMLGDPQTGAPIRVLPSHDTSIASPPTTALAGLRLSGSVRVAPVAGPGFEPAALAWDGTITVGRSAESGIVVLDPMVSSRHAALTRLGAGRYGVEDLRSTNGTFVDGNRVDRCELQPGSVLSIGRVSWRASTEGLIRVAEEQLPASGGVAPATLSVSGVSYSVPAAKQEHRAGAASRKVLLDDVTFNVPPRTLVAVIGPSGAGKSTMLKTMVGTVTPDAGQVLFNGLDMSVFAGSIADRVGIVPQDDLLHHELTARQTLSYAARLRFPDDTAPAERDAAVEWALTELGLREHADTRVRQLSGGQRKRVSTAMELLTKPDLLFLDEPTSGLDPNLDREVMELLRDLAHGTPQSPGGRTIVVITHSTDNLDKADLTLLLAPGGKVAYFGPPGDLVPFFSARLGGDTSYSSIYGLIAREPDRARATFAASTFAQPPATVVPQVAAPSRRSRSRRSLLPQVLTLLGRQARLMGADRSLLLFTIALPIVVGLLTLAVRAANGFGPATETKAVGEPRILLVVLVFGAVLMGMVPSVRQLVGERPIFLREAGVGVRPSAYLAAKVTLLGLVCGIQSVLMVGVALALNPHPERGVAWPFGVELFLVAFATSWACSALGLLLSGLVATSEQVMPLMVLVLMFQLVMCGGVLDVSGPGINQASLLSPSRWGYAAGASSLDFNRTITCNAQVLAKAKEDEEVNRKAKEATDEANQKAADDATKHGLPVPTPEVPKVHHTVVDCATVDGQDPLWDASGVRWFGNMLGLAFWFCAFCTGTYASLRRTLRN